MTLHLLKLCVGCDSIADLEGWIEENRLLHKRLGRDYRQVHTTRQYPKRAGDIVGGGSLYWVIKGRIAARQRVLAIEPFKDGEGISRTHFVLEPEVVKVSPRPFRAFQGWRYLEAKDAPSDLDDVGTQEMPENLRVELASLGLL